MPVKYHIKIAETPPRFHPVAPFSALETEGCLGCQVCVKRSSCVYDVYTKGAFSSEQIIDTKDAICVNCMRCVQECKKSILSRTRNPQFTAMGDRYWKPEIIASIWSQAANGKIPVSGAGYRGPFTGPGFDQMWTDMSEIVRPTRDGIHGREYISTVIELGQRPSRLTFDGQGRLTTTMPPIMENPIPFILDMPATPFVNASTQAAVIEAAKKLQTLVMISTHDFKHGFTGHPKQAIVKFNPAKDDFTLLAKATLVEVPYAQDAAATLAKIKKINPDIIVSVFVPLDELAKDRAVELVKLGAAVLRFDADHNGQGRGAYKDFFITTLMKDIHARLLENLVREQVTILVSGGLAMAEHVAKIIACGADGVVLDKALLAALGCRLCADCLTRSNCPVGIDTVPLDWGAQRITNLLGSWHSQLLEVLGAMGLREVRRLRGELGRVMFFKDLEEENFRPLFGYKPEQPVAGLNDGATDHENPDWQKYASKSRPATACPSRFRNQLGQFKVVRTAACTSCGTCAKVCSFGVHKKAGSRMAVPQAHLCRGPEFCINNHAYCVTSCPEKALRVGPDPLWVSFGDPRWTADLLKSTWIQAETGLPPQQDLDYKQGGSGGGLDRIDFIFPKKEPAQPFKPEDIDISLLLNRRKDDTRPKVTIGVPFYGGGMSYGSISLETILGRAIAYKAFDSFTNTGEGGFPEELKEYDDHVITQIATGLFGVKEETIQRTRLIEFKYAQGAKPGLGGHLLGDKNTPAVARMREAVQGYPLFSPFPFHSVYSVEDHKKHLDWVKEVNPRALVAVKVSGANDVDMVAVGSYYAGAHIVHLDGSYGGTGAAPDIAKKNIAMPIEYAVSKVHRFLKEEGIRDEITLIASGGLRTAWDIAKAIALGADGVVVGTSEVVALECIRCGACESGRGCPRGIATTDPVLSVLYDRQWAAQRLINLFHSWSVQLRYILWRLGMKNIRELVGRADLLAHIDYTRQPPLERDEKAETL